MTRVTIALCAVLCAATGICEINVSTVEELKTALENAKSGRGWTDPETIVLKPGVYDLSRLGPAEVDAKASWNTAVAGSAAGLTYLQTAVPFCILKGGGRTPEETVLDGKLAADVRALTCRRERFGVANLTFRNFTTTGRGGALWGVRRISNCRFENCRAAEGGAVFYPGNPYGEYAEARDSVFVRNCSAGAGGALFGLWTASNCVFSANVARGGQGGAGAGSPARLTTVPEAVFREDFTNAPYLSVADWTETPVQIPIIIRSRRRFTRTRTVSSSTGTRSAMESSTVRLM